MSLMLIAIALAFLFTGHPLFALAIVCLALIWQK